MFTTLAQETAPVPVQDVPVQELARPTGNIFEIVNSLVAKGDPLADGQQLASTLQQMSLVWALVFLIAGITCMLKGYKYYKAVTVILATALGGVGGYYLGSKIGAAYIVAGCLALLLAVCCFPLMKYAVAVMGGLAGAFIGANVWSASANIVFQGERAQQMADTYWVGALVGLLVLGMLAFILFKLSIMLFTSMSGSTLAVMGAIAIALHVPTWETDIVSSLSAHPIVIPLMILVPTMIGILMQQADPGIKNAAAPA